MRDDCSNNACDLYGLTILVTTGRNIAIFESLIRISGKAPEPFFFHVTHNSVTQWITAVILSIRHGIIRIVAWINEYMFMWTLGVPTLAGVAVLSNLYLSFVIHSLFRLLTFCDTKLRRI